MNAGYYYHVEAVFEPDGSAMVPANVGTFIVALADRIGGTLTFYAHGVSTPTGAETMRLASPRIRCVDLGRIGSHPARLFTPRRWLRRFDPEARGLDVVIAHAPTPLLPHLIRRSASIPFVLLVWGDYAGWRPQPTLPWWRNVGIRILLRIYNRWQIRASRNALVFANDPNLAGTVGAECLRVMPFSTISEGALPGASTDTQTWLAETGRTEPVRLIYAGRIAREKGLFEAVESLAILAERGYNARLELAGGEARGAPLLAELEAFAVGLGVQDRLRYLGSLGAEDLFRAYRDAHIFVIPTRWDSFPRAMHEAMAWGLPVVATRVGGIEHHLRDRETALLIEPNDASAVAGAVQVLVDDEELRRRITTSGTEWAQMQTVESNADSVVSTVESYLRDAESGLSR